MCLAVWRCQTAKLYLPHCPARRTVARVLERWSGCSSAVQENTAANFRLWEALQHSMALIARPGCPLPLVWRSFGVHVEDAWREDGFCVAFQPATATVAAAHDAILRIARQFEQARSATPIRIAFAMHSPPVRT